MNTVMTHQTDAHRQIVAVAVAVPVYDTFSYSVPAHLATQARVGVRVLVPFGKRAITGYLIGPARPTDPLEVKHILDILDDTPLFPATMIPLFQWIAGYYMHPLGQVISTALPAGLNLADVAVLTLRQTGQQAMAAPSRSPLEQRILSALANGPMDIKQLHKTIGQPVSWALIHQMRRRRWIDVERRIKARQVRPKTVRMVSLNGAADLPDRSSEQRRTIRNLLETHGDLSIPALKRYIPTASGLVRAMQKAGQVVVYEKHVYRDPFGDPIEPDMPPRLTDEQEAVVQQYQIFLSHASRRLGSDLVNLTPNEICLRAKDAGLPPAEVARVTGTFNRAFYTKNKVGPGEILKMAEDVELIKEVGRG